MKKYTVELIKEQLEKLGIEVEPEFTYPLFKQFKDTGGIIKFTSMTKGIIVWRGNTDSKIGYVSDTFVEHTSDIWKDVAYDSERGLWDGQPILYWDINDTHEKIIGFYDAKRKCSYSRDGHRIGWFYDNYRALPSDRYDEWIIEAYKTLEK